MKQLIVKKDNALVNAAYVMTLAEQRLLLLASAKAGGEKIALQGLKLQASEYAESFNVSSGAAYKALKEAAEGLFERRVTFHEGAKKTVTRWVSHVVYQDGCIEIAFAPKVQPLLCELKNRFTLYALEQVASLTSIHAVRLYELLIAWRSTGKTPVFELQDFRQKLGVEPDEYPRMTNFKQRVLDPALAQINAHTDINASYEQHKRGRSITGFSFTFTARNERDPNTVDMLTGKTDAEAGRVIRPLTEKQRQLFSEKLAHHPGMSHLSNHSSYSAFAVWIFKELEKPERVQEWMPNLIACGFMAGKK